MDQVPDLAVAGLLATMAAVTAWALSVAASATERARPLAPPSGPGRVPPRLAAAARPRPVPEAGPLEAAFAVPGPAAWSACRRTRLARGPLVWSDPPPPVFARQPKPTLTAAAAWAWDNAPTRPTPVVA